MDLLKRRALPGAEAEFITKIAAQTLIVSLGIVGNLYTILRVRWKSTLPRSTSTLITSLSVALVLQSLNALVDFTNHLQHQDEYAWGFTGCDVWHSLNLLLPTLLTLHCCCCLLDRLVLLSRPDQHDKLMSPTHLAAMIATVYSLPVLVTVPSVYFKWHAAEDYYRWRTNKECKFKTNFVFAVIFPIVTFWIPLALNAVLIGRIFLTMQRQDQAKLQCVADPDQAAHWRPQVQDRVRSRGVHDQGQVEEEQDFQELPGGAGEKLSRVKEQWRQQMLALTLWSVYWNVALFWIPHHIWQFVSKIMDADWPRAASFMVWTGYFPSVIVPALYLYYDVYNL